MKKTFVGLCFGFLVLFDAFFIAYFVAINVRKTTVVDPSLPIKATATAPLPTAPPPSKSTATGPLATDSTSSKEIKQKTTESLGATTSDATKTAPPAQP